MRHLHAMAQTRALVHGTHRTGARARAARNELDVGLRACPWPARAPLCAPRPLDTCLFGSSLPVATAALERSLAPLCWRLGAPCPFSPDTTFAYQYLRRALHPHSRALPTHRFYAPRSFAHFYSPHASGMEGFEGQKRRFSALEGFFFSIFFFHFSVSPFFSPFLLTFLLLLPMTSRRALSLVFACTRPR